MKKLFGALSLLGCLALALPAAAQNTQGRFRTAQLGDVLALTDLSTTRTFTITRDKLTGLGLMTLVMVHATHATNATLTMTCQGGVDAAASSPTTSFFADLQECDLSTAGTCDSDDAQWTKALAATKTWMWRVNVAGMNELKCSLTLPGGAAGDGIRVLGYGSTF